MRRGGGEYPDAFGEYEKSIAMICSKVSSLDGGFVYQSAKDVLKWYKLSAKEHIHTVMSIGNLLYLEDKNFENFKNDNSFLEVTKEELQDIYKEYERGKDTNRSDGQGIKTSKQDRQGSTKG